MLKYAFLHLGRNVKSALAALLSYFAILAVVLFIQQSAQSRQNTMEDMIGAMVVKGEIADSFGNETDYLQMPASAAQLFLEGHDISELVTEVNVRAQYEAVIDPEQPDEKFALVGITRTEADKPLYLNGGILFEEGFDESIWTKSEPVCAVSPDVLPYCYAGEDGYSYLDLYVKLYSKIYNDLLYAPVTLRVCGTAVSSGAVFCPYPELQELCENSNATFRTDALSFTVLDNAQLDRLRQLLDLHFGDSDIQNAGKMQNTVILKDAEYLRLTGEAQKNMEIMVFLQPVLYLCALGAGIMLVVLQMRGRKKEMAVIRSLGAGRLRVMMQSILEYVIICLPVTLFALLIWRELSPMTVIGVWLAFMLGALCTVARFSMVPLVKQIRELEE